MTLEWLHINPRMCRYVYAHVCVCIYRYSVCALPPFLAGLDYVQPMKDS